MKIKNLTIAGFRGFNEQKAIDFHDQLTLIYAPNSCGKTSISEAVEWLYYGVTSKIEHADSKTEYKGSYRNCHFPNGATPFVEGVFISHEGEIKFKAELGDNDESILYYNGSEVTRWPLDELPTSPRPFILQHTLKYLLLTEPIGRYRQVANLIGLTELEQIEKDFISLCTKPAVPSQVNQLQKTIDSLQARVGNRSSLAKIAAAFKKGKKGVGELKQAIYAECNKIIVSAGLTDPSQENRLPYLLQIRKEQVGKFYPGRIDFFVYSDTDNQELASNEERILRAIGQEAIRKYSGFGALSAARHILNLAQFYELGTQFLQEEPDVCPFCGQMIDQEIAEHIEQNHRKSATDSRAYEVHQEELSQFRDQLSNLKTIVEATLDFHSERTNPFLAIESSLDQLKAVLTPKHKTHFEAVQTAYVELQECKNQLELLYYKVFQSIEEILESLEKSQTDINLMVGLGEVLVRYISASKNLVTLVSKHAESVSNAGQILLHELDVLAGTEDVSLLIDLLEHFADIEKKFEIDWILGDGLKQLRKSVEQYSATKMRELVAGEMTAGVMEWYDKIKTTGDPDVHFKGFDMGRTKSGSLKSRQIDVNASSYGTELVSAVSSLSESKLNVLGLSISISANLNSNTPFEFLVIDDPTQSLDKDHETRFIEVIRELVGLGKQIILLSHDSNWIREVRSHCLDINGFYYEITGYDESGPVLSEMEWQPWKARLTEVDSILKDKNASTVRLQHAEQEIRIAAAQIAGELYKKKTGKSKRVDQLNKAEVRKALIECGVEMKLVNKICQTFGNTDDAHHAPDGYSPQSGRIQQYYSYLYELAQLLK